MAGGTQRDDVLQGVSVANGQDREFSEQPDRNDVVHVRVPAEIVGVGTTEDTRVVVPLQGALSNLTPARALTSSPR